MGVSEAVSISSGSESDGDRPAKKANVNTDYRTWKHALRLRLNGIKSVGDIANFTRYPTFANPGLKIENHPPLPLPLTASDAEIIKKACHEAPFGKGEDTVVDTSVRKTWELEHAKFSLANPEWPAFLQTIALTAASSLGLLEITVKPHKLLLYEKGSFFKRHKDSEKEPGMVGTLVVCLPSEHQGGEVHLTFGSDQRIFQTAPTSTFDLTTLAWFSDVTHEVKELTSGYRLALTYNIIQKGLSKQSAGFFGEQAQQVKQMLGQWHAKFPSKDMLVYPLDHKYSESSLSLRNMKGRDKAVCQALHNVASQSGAFLLLAHQTHSTGEDEDEANSYGYRLSCDIEAPRTYLDVVFTPEGKKIATNHDLEDDQILTPNLYKNRKPDSEEEGEFTGNEGAESTFRYHDTVAVIVKKSSFHKFLKTDRWGVGPDAHTDNMVAMVVKDMEENRGNASTRATCLNFLVPALKVGKAPQKTTICTAVYWALQLESAKVFEYALMMASQSGSDTYTEAIDHACRYFEERFAENPEAIEWNKWLGETMSRGSLSGVSNTVQYFTPRFKSDAIRSSFSKWGESQLAWKLETLADLNESDLSFFVMTLEARCDSPDWVMSSLLPALESRGNRGLIYRVLNTVFLKREQREFSNAKDIFQRVLQNALPKLLLQGEDMIPATNYYSASSCSGPLTDFVYCVNEGLTVGAAEPATQMLEACCNNLVWTKNDWNPCSVGEDVVDAMLVPLVTTLKKHNVPVTQPIKDLFITIIGEGLHQQLAPFPPRPQGWSFQPRKCEWGSQGPGHCLDCDEFSTFLVSPDQREWRLRAAERRRSHIENLLYSCMNLFRVTTEKFTSPYVLVIEKIGSEYDLEVDKWSKQAHALERRLSPLRTELVTQLLGEAEYRRLVLLEDYLRQAVWARSSGVKREADGQPQEHPYDNKRQMWYG